MCPNLLGQRGECVHSSRGHGHEWNPGDDAFRALSFLSSPHMSSVVESRCEISVKCVRASESVDLLLVRVSEREVRKRQHHQCLRTESTFPDIVPVLVSVPSCTASPK